ncbi:sigma-54-dependent transcriptional regulator [Aureliella helgolandensis]|uniref:Transcriptional regulatory protein ZraR n=1 Tax=Aureliella helgolandensis TaxID=2527968 RepID=A0A518GDI9_9BACT|nr:sigma-54 dependent transcriptional regulator [Aureliella helgolandensis]QDV26674.1 Transcriptional regulatory protein ZraR [Aureliella helgolandensis]
MGSERAIRILVADDEPLYLRTTGALLRKEGFECVCVANGELALSELNAQPFDLILSDLNMPGNFQLELLKQGRESWPRVPLIVITGVPSLPTAIESLRLGIADYLLKPVKYGDLLASIRRVLATSAHGRSDLADQAEMHPDDQEDASGPNVFHDVIGESPCMLEIFDVVSRVARTNASVLITGESGTGKEVLARSLHAASRRASHRLQIIDCTAIPETLFESVLFGHRKGSFTGAVNDQNGLLGMSDQGTVFFDEIGELPTELQAKLLRVIQEQTYTPVGMQVPIQIDTRFVCATNRDLEMEVNARRFRRDLFYRLAVVHIELPPLRERQGDVRLLADHFLKLLRPAGSKITGFTEAVLESFERYSWPGNIRELRNVVERGLVLTRGEQIDVADLPHSFQKSVSIEHAIAGDSGRGELGQVEPEQATLHAVMEGAEMRYLRMLLEEQQGNVSQAAVQAGMSRQGLHKLLKKHGINAAEFRK